MMTDLKTRIKEFLILHLGGYTQTEYLHNGEFNYNLGYVEGINYVNRRLEATLRGEVESA